MSTYRSNSGWQAGRKTDDTLLSSSRLTTTSPRKTGSMPSGASDGEPANKKQKLSSKKAKASSDGEEADTDDTIDCFKANRPVKRPVKTYARHSRPTQRRITSPSDSPHKPVRATTSSRKGKEKDIVELDGSSSPQSPSRTRANEKSKKRPIGSRKKGPSKVVETEEDESEVEEITETNRARKPKPFPSSQLGVLGSQTAKKAKSKVKEFPMEIGPSKSAFSKISYELSDENVGDDTMRLTSPKQKARGAPAPAPFPMSATQLGSQTTIRTSKEVPQVPVGSQFSSYRSNDDEMISDSNAEKENRLPLLRQSPLSSKRRSSGSDDGSDGPVLHKKKRKKADKITPSSSSASILSRRGRASPPPSPSRLCPFCDEVLPPKLSTRLRNMIDTLVSRSHVAPRPGNPQGRDAPLALSINICSAHRAEAQTIPLGIKRGWPRSINFKELPQKIKERAIKDDLDGIVNASAATRDSKFWVAACQDIKKRGARVANSVHGQMDTFHLTQPGYFGEQGFLVISEALQVMYPRERLETADIGPMNSQDFLRRVLVPETAIRLIMEGMEQDYDAAMKTMEESREYGIALFPARDNDGDVSFDLSIRMDSPPKAKRAPAPEPQKTLVGKPPTRERSAHQQSKHKSKVINFFDSDSAPEVEVVEPTQRLEERGSSQKEVLVKNSSAPSSQNSIKRGPLPKPAELRKESDRKTNSTTGSTISEYEVQELLLENPGASASTTSSSKGTSSRDIKAQQPVYIRPRKQSTPPRVVPSRPVSIPVPQPGSSKPSQQLRSQTSVKKSAGNKGKSKALNPNDSLDLIPLGRANPLPSMNSNSQKHRQLVGHHLEKSKHVPAKNILSIPSTSRIGLSRGQKLESNNRSGSRSNDPTPFPNFTPKKPPSHDVEVLVDPPTSEMKKDYVRTPDKPKHLYSRTMRQSPARFTAKRGARKGLATIKSRRQHSVDEPEEIDSESGGKRIHASKDTPAVDFTWLLGDSMDD